MATDPRVARSRSKILQAAIEVLLSEGAAGVTIEAVAASSGVAKTTIYRQWRDREELLIEAISSLSGGALVYAQTASLRADLVCGLTHLVDGLNHAAWGRAVPTMLDAAERDEHFAQLTRAFIENRRRPLRKRLEVAKRSGELPAASEVDLLLGLLVGPFFYRRYITRQPISAAFARRVVDTVLAGAIGDAAEETAG